MNKIILGIDLHFGSLNALINAFTIFAGVFFAIKSGFDEKQLMLYSLHIKSPSLTLSFAVSPGQRDRYHSQSHPQSPKNL